MIHINTTGRYMPSKSNPYLNVYNIITLYVSSSWLRNYEGKQYNNDADILKLPTLSHIVLIDITRFMSVLHYSAHKKWHLKKYYNIPLALNKGKWSKSVFNGLTSILCERIAPLYMIQKWDETHNCIENMKTITKLRNLYTYEKHMQWFGT